MRYTFTQVTGHPDKYRVADSTTGLVVEFTKHRFNEDHEFIEQPSIPVGLSASELASYVSGAMRDLGDWLVLHHSYEALPPQTYELRAADDDSSVMVIRRKAPKFTATFAAGTDLGEMAKALSKAAEYIRKIKAYE